MAITATAQPANVPPRVQISITGLTDLTTQITRLDPDGRSRPVRTAEPAALSGGAWLGYDYEMPLGTPVTYTSTPPVNATQSATPVTVTSTDGWLLHPGVPDLSIRLIWDRVVELGERTRAARSAILQPLGRNSPIAVSEARSSAQAGLTFITETYDERDAVWAALDGGSPMLLNLPADWQFGVTWEYVTIGDATEAPITRGLSASRSFTLPYTVIDRPAGALQAQWTYAGVSTNYTTLTQVLASYSSYTNLLANNPI